MAGGGEVGRHYDTRGGGAGGLFKPLLRSNILSMNDTSDNWERKYDSNQTLTRWLGLNLKLYKSSRGVFPYQ